MQFRNTSKEMDKLYAEYSKDREKLINKLSRVVLEFKVKEEYMDLNSQQVNTLNKDFKKQIDDMIAAEKRMETEYMENALRDAANNTYNYKEYLYSLGIAFDLKPLTDKKISDIINKEISGKAWSDRIWANKNNLEIKLKKNIDDCVKGKISINKINQNIIGEFESSRNNTKRLVRTEMARVQGAVADEFDKKHKIEWQMWLSTLDKKTSDKCQSLDGKKFRTNDKTKPTIPAHPNCRSVLIGIPDENYKPLSRRDNESGDIINFKTYDEWSGKAKPSPIPTKTPPKPKGMDKRTEDIINKIGTKYKEPLLEELKKGNKTALEVFNKYSDRLVFGDTNHKGGAYYLPSKKLINMNIEKDSKSLKGSFSTFFHEYGHLIDNTSQGGREFISSSNKYDFKNTMKQDLKHYEKRIRDLLKEINGEKPEIAELRNAINRKLNGHSNAGISDIMEGVSNGRYHGMYGHGKNYWKTAGNLETEAFANLFQIQINGSKETLKLVKEIFPESFKKFKEMLKEIAGGV